ncbi:hypothetical protein JCM8202v2_002422 [Rhodotorula sphaerocarpa]
MLHGGATSNGNRWGMGGKTWRAPSDAERAREAQDRLARETERRRIQEIEHMERNIRKERDLGAKAARINQQALGFERGAHAALYPGGGLGVAPSPRVRPASFSGIGGSPLAGRYPGSHMLGGRGPGVGGSPLLGGMAGPLDDALRRRARSMSRERAALAGLGMAGDRLLTPGLSPHRSPYLGAVGGGYGGGLPGRPLGHRRSWSGTLPGAGMGHLGYGHSPRLLPHGHGGGLAGGLPGVGHLPPLGYRSRSPSASRVLVSPRIGHPPSPRVVNYNHNTYNISPHHRGHELGVGGLGALDDLHLGGGAVDPILLDEFTGGAPGYGQDFVVTDASLVEGRRILRDLGAVEGFSGLNAYKTEDERLNLAIADLTARAQARGANAVLSVETGEDVGGQIVVRGLAALLA